MHNMNWYNRLKQRLTKNKLISPIWDWRSTPAYCQLQSHVTQKLGQKSKIRPRQALGIPPNLRIRGHLPAPIINGGEDSLWKRPNFRLSRAHDLDLDLDRVVLHTVMHHSSTSTYIPNFIEIEETFCGRTDGCTDGRTDIWDPLY